jgi:peptidoglycan/LPS O-acetylase OafA/YrhL
MKSAIQPSDQTSPLLVLSSQRIAELDGFRAIAVTMVFVMHIFLGGGLPSAAFDRMPSSLFQLISHGWLGVDLFFLLSGFLITGILVDSRASDSSVFFRSFYARRALRILPLYFTCIAVMALCYRGAGSYFVLSAAFLANFSHAFHVSQPHGPSVFWSLAIEEHFYALWPLLVWACTRRVMLAILVAIIIVSPVLRGVGAAFGMDPEKQIYEYSFFRFDGLALGAALALTFRSPAFTRRRALGLAAALLALDLIITVVGSRYGLHGRKTVAATALRYTQAQLAFGAMLVVALVYRRSLITRPLRSRVAVFIADLSFCIYLVHLALIDLYVTVLHRFGVSDLRLLGSTGTVAVRSCVVGVAAVIVAMLSRKYLERPLLRLKGRFPYAGALSAAARAQAPRAN